MFTLVLHFSPLFCVHSLSLLLYFSTGALLVFKLCFVFTHALLFKLFHMKITASVAKTCIRMVARATNIYLLFFYKYTPFFCCKTKSSCDCCFPEQIRPQNTVQLHRLKDCPNVEIVFNMNNKHHALSIVVTSLNTLIWINLHCSWIHLISLLNFPEKWVADYKICIQNSVKHLRWSVLQ